MSSRIERQLNEGRAIGVNQLTIERQSSSKDSQSAILPQPQPVIISVNSAVDKQSKGSVSSSVPHPDESTSEGSTQEVHQCSSEDNHQINLFENNEEKLEDLVMKLDPEIFSFDEPQSIQEPVQKQLQQDVGNKKEVKVDEEKFGKLVQILTEMKLKGKKTEANIFKKRNSLIKKLMGNDSAQEYNNIAVTVDAAFKKIFPNYTSEASEETSKRASSDNVEEIITPGAAESLMLQTSVSPLASLNSMMPPRQHQSQSPPSYHTQNHTIPMSSNISKSVILQQPLQRPPPPLQRMPPPMQKAPSQSGQNSSQRGLNSPQFQGSIMAQGHPQFHPSNPPPYNQMAQQPIIQRETMTSAQPHYPPQYYRSQTRQNIMQQMRQSHPQAMPMQQWPMQQTVMHPGSSQQVQSMSQYFPAPAGQHPPPNMVMQSQQV